MKNRFSWRSMLCGLVACVAMCLGTVAQAAPPVGMPESITITPPTASGLSPFVLPWDEGNQVYGQDGVVNGQAGWAFDPTGSAFGPQMALYQDVGGESWYAYLEGTYPNYTVGEYFGSGPYAGWGSAGFQLGEGPAIPEPASLGLMALGLLPLLCSSRRRSTRQSS